MTRASLVDVYLVNLLVSLEHHFEILSLFEGFHMRLESSIELIHLYELLIRVESLLELPTCGDEVVLTDIFHEIGEDVALHVCREVGFA